MNRCFVAAECNLRTGQHFGSRDSLVLDRRQEARENGFANQREGRALFQRRDRCPLARALLAGDIQNLTQQRRARLILITLRSRP